MGEEEKAEKEIAKLENRAGKLQNRLAGEVDDRAWFQTKQQRKEEKMKLKKQEKDPTFTKQKAKKRKAVAAMNPEEERENKQMMNEADYLTRQNKKAKILKKIRVFNEESTGPKTKQQKKSKSSFESELANVSSKSVKKVQTCCKSKEKRRP